MYNAGRRSVLRTIGALGIAGTGVPGVVMGNGRGQAAGEAAIVGEDGESIQAAIDGAEPGDAVRVREGTYREQVLIDKDLELRGDAGATIEAPDAMTALTIPESGPAVEPVVFAYGGEVEDGAVSGDETIDVSISGFEIDGRDRQPDARRRVGVLCRNVGGRGPASIARNDVLDMGVGGRETMGILVYGDSDVLVEGNDISGFERGGIGANGDGGAHPAPRAVVRDNTIDSASPASGWAPNGIQLGYGATGTVSGNDVRNCRWADAADADWAASGILVFESDSIRVQNNTVANCDAGVGIEAWGWLRPSADNTTVTRNQITDAIYGISVAAIASDAFSDVGPRSNNNKLVDNAITNDDPSFGAVGVAVVSVDGSADYRPEAENNKIVRNTIDGFDERIVDDGERSKIAAIQP